MNALERSIDAGLAGGDWVPRDPDWEHVRDHPRFQALVARLVGGAEWGGPGLSSTFKISAGTSSETVAGARSRKARASIGVSFIRLSYRRVMPKPTQSALNKANFTGVTRRVALPASAQTQKHERVRTATSVNRLKSTNLLQRRRRFVDGTEPFTNLVQQTIIQDTLWLPGHQIMSGIWPQVSRSRRILETGKDFESSVESSGITASFLA